MNGGWRVENVSTRSLTWPVSKYGYTGVAVDTSAAKKVSKTSKDSAMVIIGVAMLVMAFATLVLKIIEVARSK